MPNLITSPNCLTAWRDACNHILQNGDGFNLIVNISTPLNFTQNQQQELIKTATNPTGIITANSLGDVVNTIFPTKLYSRILAQGLNISQLYDRHEAIYKRGKTMHSKNKSRWGNYFLRFTKFGRNKKNQLQKIIDDINNRQKSYSACYIMHTSSADLDSNTRPLGGPCLQYVQFGQIGNDINLTAVYRNHDFLHKVLGNYIGLASLLEFVCSQTNRQMGSITCHSIHYFLNNRTCVRNCLNNLTW